MIFKHLFLRLSAFLVCAFALSFSAYADGPGSGGLSITGDSYIQYSAAPSSIDVLGYQVAVDAADVKTESIPFGVENYLLVETVGVYLPQGKRDVAKHDVFWLSVAGLTAYTLASMRTSIVPSPADKHWLRNVSHALRQQSKHYAL